MKQIKLLKTRKPYLQPDMKVIFMESADIIATSGEAPNFGEGDGPVWS